MTTTTNLVLSVESDDVDDDVDRAGGSGYPVENGDPRTEDHGGDVQPWTKSASPVPASRAACW